MPSPVDMSATFSTDEFFLNNISIIILSETVVSFYKFNYRKISLTVFRKYDILHKTRTMFRFDIQRSIMSTFSVRLKQLRGQRRMKQEQLASLTGITTRSIQNYESGSRMPNSLEITEKLAAALGVTTTYLLGEEEETTPVRLLGSIACGPFNFGEENILETYHFPTAFTGKGEFFLLRTFGESMIDVGIEPGNLVLIRQQNSAKSGDIVVVSVGDETTLKRYYPEPEKKRIRLHPENESMEDMYVTECIIQGVAVKVIKDL